MSIRTKLAGETSSQYSYEEAGNVEKTICRGAQFIYSVMIKMCAQESSLVGEGMLSSNSLTNECLSLVEYIQDMRVLIQTRANLRDFFAAYIAGFDSAALRETLSEEVAKINDPGIDTNPLQQTLKSFSATLPSETCNNGE